MYNHYGIGSGENKKKTKRSPNNITIFLENYHVLYDFLFSIYSVCGEGVGDILRVNFNEKFSSAQLS